jgi:hypothetical protein
MIFTLAYFTQEQPACSPHSRDYIRYFIEQTALTASSFHAIKIPGTGDITLHRAAMFRGQRTTFQTSKSCRAQLAGH